MPFFPLRNSLFCVRLRVRMLMLGRLTYPKSCLPCRATIRIVHTPKTRKCAVCGTGHSPTRQLSGLLRIAETPCRRRLEDAAAAVVTAGLVIVELVSLASRGRHQYRVMVQQDCESKRCELMPRLESLERIHRHPPQASPLIEK